MRLNKALNTKLPELGGGKAYSVATAGSFGRMEASAQSDLDFMVITDSPLDETLCHQIIETAFDAAKELGISLPNPEGVFAMATPYEELIEKAGAKEDTLDSLAQRMLLLMEAKPVYNEAVFRNAIDLILRKYLAYLLGHPHRDAVFLLNDIIRYFRSICVNYQFNFWREGEKWAVRNAKLHHSRVIMYTGLLFTVLNASIHQDKPAYIRGMVDKTPLERIVAVYLDANDRGYERLLSAYDVFLLRMQDEQAREDLQVEYNDRYTSTAYRQMRISADVIASELTRFVFAQRDRWTQRMFEYLLF
jgi:hypothetical protein